MLYLKCMISKLLFILEHVDNGEFQFITIDVVEANTNVTPSLDEQGSTGVKRSRIT